MYQETIYKPEKELMWIKDIINKVSSEYDKIWKKRNRSIDSKFLVSFIFQKITNTNKGYEITLMDLWDNYDTRNIKKAKKKCMPHHQYVRQNKKCLKIYF